MLLKNSCTDSHRVFLVRVVPFHFMYTGRKEKLLIKHWEKCLRQFMGFRLL